MPSLLGELISQVRFVLLKGTIKNYLSQRKFIFTVIRLKKIVVSSFNGLDVHHAGLRPPHAFHRIVRAGKKVSEKGNSSSEQKKSTPYIHTQRKT